MLLPTEQMLQEAAQDVAHEISLFWGASEHLFQPPAHHLRDRFRYQAWYVLARNLMDFFDTTTVERGDADDVVAGDYFGPPLTW